MTRSSFFHRISACLLFFLGVLLLNACADEERKLPPTSPAGEGTSSQVLVLCQGNQATRLPGGYTLIDTEHQTVNHDAFLSVNGKLLGDAPQEAIQHGAKIYIPCYGSNLVQVVDASSHRLLRSISTSTPEGVAAWGKYVFVSNNDGNVSRIDTLSLTVDRTVAVGPNPVGVSTQDNYIYVAISDGYNYKEGYKQGFKVVKLHPNTLEQVGEIRVGMNPTRIYKDDFGHLFVACQGDYATHAAEIWRIDQKDQAAVFASANLAAVDDTAFISFAPPPIGPQGKPPCNTKCATRVRVRPSLRTSDKCNLPWIRRHWQSIRTPKTFMWPLAARSIQKLASPNPERSVSTTTTAISYNATTWERNPACCSFSGNKRDAAFAPKPVAPSSCLEGATTRF